MSQLNENEMSSAQTSTSLNHSAEATQVVSDTTNYTPDEQKNQVTSDNSTKSTGDANLDKKFYSGDKMLYGIYTDYLIKNHHIVTIQDKLHIYIKGIYVSDVKQIEKLILTLTPNAKPADVKTILNNLRIKSPEVEVSNPKYVAFLNGILNVHTLKFMEFDPDKFYLTNRIYAYYKPDELEKGSSSVKFVKDYLYSLSCGNPVLEKLYLGMNGYCLVNKYNEQLAFFLKGDSNNGKSIFLKAIESQLRKHCSHLSLEELSTQKSLINLYNCTANIVDDTGQPKKFDTEQIQSLVTGGTVSVKQKDGSCFEFKPCATLLIATTKTLYFKDFNDSLIRRFIVVPFNANFDTGRNKNMEDEICSMDNLSILATMAIQAYSEIARDGEFHIPDFVKEDTIKYFMESNPVLEFVKTHPIARLMIKGEYIKKYENWCTHNNKIPLADNVFGKKLLDLGYYKSVDPTFDGIRNDYYAVPSFNADEFRKEYAEFVSNNPDKVSSIFGYIDYLNKQNGL